ncbi:MAG TPA: circadian clock KaiB family protein [Bryobacteraceae bacterium]|nr:circadian clock KaiB family protein [Bryobacteraceae bacterium]
MKRRRSQDETAAFEDALAADPNAPHYLLRLFVSGTTPKSTRAIQNIRALCEQRLHGRYELEVIDIYQHPEFARPEQIVVTPTLVKKLPLPFRKIIGDLSDTERVLVGMDLVSRPAAAQAPESRDGG